MLVYQNYAIGFKKLELEDAEMLVKWLSDPTVLEYYEGRDRPHDLALVMEHFYEDADEEMMRCIVQYEGINIGYIQFYAIGEDEKDEYGYNEFQGTIYGMDQFIGEPEYWNRGVGSQMIQAAVEYLFEQRGIDKIVMDPQAWNARALRVYEKNGFVRSKYLEKHEWHEGEYRDCWIIEHNRLPR